MSGLRWAWHLCWRAYYGIARRHVNATRPTDPDLLRLILAHQHHSEAASSFIQ